MGRVREYFASNWHALLLWLISLGSLWFLLFFRLAKLTNNLMSGAEAEAIAASSSGAKILANPLWLPHKLLDYGVHNFAQHSLYAHRAVSAVFGVLFVLFFYSLAKKWFSPRIAWFTTLICASSSWFLHYARIATPQILLPLSLIAILWAVWWLHATKHNKKALAACALAMASAVYVPGMIWFSVLVVVLQRRHLGSLRQKVPLKYLAGMAVVILALLAPLARAIWLDPSLATDVLALPESYSVPTFLKDAAYVPFSLVVRSQTNPVYNLDVVALLDVFTATMAVLGVYTYVTRLGLVRTRALALTGIIAWILIALKNPVDMSLLLPIIYLLAAGGIMQLLKEWYKVFPFNPLARSLGVALLLVLIGITGFYHYTRYFEAWPHNPATKTTFTINI